MASIKSKNRQALADLFTSLTSYKIEQRWSEPIILRDQYTVEDQTAWIWPTDETVEALSRSGPQKALLEIVQTFRIALLQTLISFDTSSQEEDVQEQMERFAHNMVNQTLAVDAPLTSEVLSTSTATIQDVDDTREQRLLRVIVDLNVRSVWKAEGLS